MIVKEEHKTNKVSTTELKDAIIEVLEDSKAEDIEVIDLNGKSDIADMMIVASGKSDRHVKSLAVHVGRLAKQLGRKRNIEGLEQKDWVLIDCFDVIIHLFHAETRKYYNIEGLWAKRSRE